MRAKVYYNHPHSLALRCFVGLLIVYFFCRVTEHTRSSGFKAALQAAELPNLPCSYSLACLCIPVIFKYSLMSVCTRLPITYSHLCMLLLVLKRFILLIHLAKIQVIL